MSSNDETRVARGLARRGKITSLSTTLAVTDTRCDNTRRTDDDVLRAEIAREARREQEENFEQSETDAPPPDAADDDDASDGTVSAYAEYRSCATYAWRQTDDAFEVVIPLPRLPPNADASLVVKDGALFFFSSSRFVFVTRFASPSVRQPRDGGDSFSSC